jgi:hypothetical protein
MISLHIFTNSTVNAPSTHHIDETYQSFLDTFGEIHVTVWCDPNPNLQNSKQYIKNLKFSTINVTKSLSDGYVKAIKQNKDEFLFMLEHDWKFLDIKHSIKELCEQMNESSITHLRFNKRTSRAVKCDANMTQEDGSIFSYCLTPCVSNNPHIIHRQRYIETALPHIEISTKSYGIENRLNNKGIKSAIYGPLNLPRTVQHLHGRI